MSNPATEKVKQSLSTKIGPAQARAWSRQQTTPVSALTQQAMSMPPQSTPQGLSVLKLNIEQSAKYAEWTQKGQKWDVPVAKVFGASPTFEAFETFMTKLQDIRESPPLGASPETVAKSVQKEVDQYVGASTVTPAQGWGGQDPTVMPTAHLEKKAPETAEPDAEPAAPWAGKKFTWDFSQRVKKHIKNKDLVSSEGFPTTLDDLVDYVVGHPDEFKKTPKGNWKADLGGLATKAFGGGKDVKYWSIVVSVQGNKGFIFHYGPTQLYQDT